MSDELLNKEKELDRLNKELEIKTPHVLEEIKSIGDQQIHNNSSRQNNVTIHTNDMGIKNEKYSMKTTEINAGSSHTLTEETSNLLKQNVAANFQNQNEGNKVNKIVSHENNVLIDFLKKELNMLRDEFYVTQLEYKNKETYCEKLEKANNWHYRMNSSLEEIITLSKKRYTELENNNSNLHHQNLALNAENYNLKEDKKELRKQIEILNRKLDDSNFRLNRFVVENEKLRSTNRFMLLQEKELIGRLKQIEGDKKQEIKYSQDRRYEALLALTRRVLFFDNIEKNDGPRLSAEMRHRFKEEFSKIVNWNEDNL